MDFCKARIRPIALLSAIVLVSALCVCNATGSPKGPDAIVREVSDPRIEKYLQKMVVDEHLTGAVLVARGTQVIHAKGYGPATSELDNNPATLFHVASITKQFTAAAIMQLVEAGLVDLDETINSYLPEMYRAEQWDAVSVNHLLTHSSGITDYAVERDYYNVVDGFCLGDTVQGMIREAMSNELEFVPGTQFAYSNIGFTLLGAIIENVSEKPYDVYLEQNLLRPMGMRSSRIHIEGHVPEENEAQGFRWSEDQNAHVPDDVVSLPVTAPDGGLVTTLADFLRWVQIYARAEQSILSQSSIEKMTARHIDSDGKDGPMESYGYGLATGERLIGHAGYIVGFRSQFIFAPEIGLLVAIFTNNTTNDPQRMASEILSILLVPRS